MQIILENIEVARQVWNSAECLQVGEQTDGRSHMQIMKKNFENKFWRALNITLKSLNVTLESIKNHWQLLSNMVNWSEEVLKLLWHSFTWRLDMTPKYLSFSFIDSFINELD